MTERLYYTDAYRTEFDAAVVAVTELAGRPALFLDQSAFYPTSGGQPYDTGVLAGYSVVDVVVADGAVCHILDRAANPALTGQIVQGRVDWPRRHDHMQQHSGQHLISQVFTRLYGYETLSVHFGEEESTLDLDAAELTPEQIDRAELMANDVVFRAIPIQTYFVNDAELDTVPLRRPPKVSGQIRIVEIAGFDWSACGGTHVHTTAEIGAIKFTRQQRMRGQARISFLCGQRALLDYRLKHRLITEAAALYSTDIAQVPELIARDQALNKDLQYRLEQLQSSLLAYEAQDLVQQAMQAGGCAVVARAYDDRDANSLKTLANQLIAEPHTVALLGSSQGGKITVVFARGEQTPLHAGNLLRTSLQRFGGEGGGRPDFAQGGGIAPGNLADLIAYALEQAAAELAGKGMP